MLICKSQVPRILHRNEKRDSNRYLAAFGGSRKT